MAQQPEVYQNIRIPPIGNLNNRLASAAKDQIFYNLIPESIVNKHTGGTYISLIKRGAFVADTTVIAGGGAGRGIYYWDKTGKTYSVIANRVYADTTDKYTLTTSTGTCWFCEDTGPSNTLILSDGTDLFSISTADVVTDIVDGDLPAGPITPVAMNGYIFVAKATTDDIHNSDLAAPTAWTSTSFLSSEMYSDTLVGLNRVGPYVIAFGKLSTEFFYDNANPTGSPLKRQDSVALRIGLTARDSMALSGKTIFFVGNAQTGESSVFKLEGLTPSKISTEYVDRILINEGSSLSSAMAWICHHKGHTLYVLNLSSASRTLVYDLDEDLWLDWSSNSASAHVVLPYNYATQGANGTILVLHNTDGKIYKLDSAVNQDTAGAILVKIVTSKIDLNNDKKKRLHRFMLITDDESSGSVTLDWTDDDYGTFSSTRTLDITTRPYANNMGYFRRRAFRLLHSTNAPLRIDAIELNYSEGEH